MSERENQASGGSDSEPTSWFGIARQITDRLFFWVEKRHRLATILLIILLAVTIALAALIPLQPNESSNTRFGIALGCVLVEVILFILYIGWSNRKGAASAETVEDDKPGKLKFTNRVNEINSILGASQGAIPMYQAIDAPAGYGKSELLKELQKRFEKLGWKCVRIVVEPGQAFSMITAGITQQLNLKTNSDLPAATKAWGERMLARYLGLVLLVDFDKDTHFSDLLIELGNLIAQIFESLKASKSFQNKEFRVVVAGRGIGQKTDSLSTSSAKSSIPFKSILLSPFRYEDVHTAARDFLPNEAPESINQLAAHTIHFTGGHPLCMHKMLELYKQSGGHPDRFVQDYDKQIWGIVAPIAENVRNSLPDSLRVNFDTLSVFRRFQSNMLDFLKGKDLLNFDNKELFIQALTGTKLVAWHDGFYRDDITRRLITIRFERQDQNRFEAVVGNSTTTYLDLLASKTPRTKRAFPYPHLCVIECIFQALRMEYLRCTGEESREILRENFFAPNGLLATFLKELPKDGNFWDDFFATLEHQENWEFRFYVNYYLRNGIYDNQPYQRLLNESRKFRLAMG